MHACPSLDSRRRRLAGERVQRPSFSRKQLLDLFPTRSLHPCNPPIPSPSHAKTRIHQIEMRFSSFGFISSSLFAGVVANAWLQRGNAYASLIHMTKSSANMMISFQFFLYLSILLGKVLSSLFFGQLRASEVEHLYEKSWFAVTETALAMTIFRDEFDIRFVALFLGLLGVKIFHWIVADRVDYVRLQTFMG